MGKASAMWGKTSGKVGGLVYAAAGGEQIVREYNPNVSNPSTDAQVNQRAKMKLMSQLSASLASSLAMQKDGLVSIRNKFTKRNFGYAGAVNGVAQVSYENLQLTEGNLALPQICAQISIFQDDRNLAVYFEEEPSANISRVVWNVYSKSQEGKLSYINSYVATQRKVTQSGTEYYFMGLINKLPAGDIVIYGYGMIDTSERAAARYGNLNVVDGSDLAKLVASRAISFTDYQFTQTRGTTMGADNQQITPTPEGSVRIFATATNGGTVTGGGTYEVGTDATLTATPDSGYEFEKWTLNGGGDYSTRNPMTIHVQSQLDLVANFRHVGQDSL